MNKLNFAYCNLFVLVCLFVTSCCTTKKIQAESAVSKAHSIIDKHLDKQADEIKQQVENAKVQRVDEGIEVEFSNNVFFEFDRYQLRDSAFLTMKHFIGVLEKYPDTNVEVQGHTDNKGTDEYNMALSEKRASSAATFLKENDINESRISVKGFGASKPEYDNGTEEGRQLNRRVEFLVTPSQKMKDDALKAATTGKN